MSMDSGAPRDAWHGRRAALVLGAGGARGLAHIGVIQALLESGIEIAAIAGSSMGALVGGIHAAGRLNEYRDWVGELQRGDVLRLLDFAFGHPGLIKGDRIIGALRELVGDHLIEDLAMPFVAVATDLRIQREAWITQGPLFDAIRASIAIPMVFTPHRVGERELVDGGLLAPVPIAATRLFSTDLLIAVDVNGQPAHRHVLARARPAHANELSASGTRIGDFVDRLLGRDGSVPEQRGGLMELMSQSLDAVQSRMSQMQLALDPPDLLVRIPHDACYFYEFWRATELIELGRQRTLAALQGWTRDHADAEPDVAANETPHTDEAPRRP
ncbi:MAG: patatin-like phospholipase family protein [Xanthomonadales bacterium]|nr:patatin-like phospholipase family protein [Xanthomonadales bacterium]